MAIKKLNSEHFDEKFIFSIVWSQHDNYCIWQCNIIIILGKTDKHNLEKGDFESVNKVPRLDDDSENSGKNV